MAAGSRTLKLTILGDVDNLNKSLKAATADVDTFGDKMTKAGKVVGAALAAAARGHDGGADDTGTVASAGTGISSGGGSRRGARGRAGSYLRRSA
jgi:hypothetical protein